MATKTQEVEIEGKTLKLSNLDKVLFPKAGFTKGQMIDYYVKVAPALLPHLHDRPITMKRYPEGVEGDFFYEKQRPKYAPEWIESVPVQTSKKTIDYIIVNDLATLVWIANLASFEIHPFLASAQDVYQPTKLTFDLDPGAPADIRQCCEVALILRELFSHWDLEAFPKTSGSKGMQIDIPLNSDVSFDQTKPFAKTIAQLLERQHPDLVVHKMEKALRPGKVLIDWSQNDDAKTTVSVYSLRAKEQPTVSTPVAWSEVEQGAAGQVLSFTTEQVLQRIADLGDLHHAVLEKVQHLPQL